jgi:hypothetical protein
MDTEAVSPDLSNKETCGLECGGSIVNGGGLDLRLSERKPQFGEMRHLVHLTAGGLEQDCCANPPVDIAQRPLGICVERAIMTWLARDIGLNSRIEA